MVDYSVLFPCLQVIAILDRVEQMALRAFAYENFLAVVNNHMATLVLSDLKS